MHGLGTVINVTAILVGATIGVLLGHRLPQRTRDEIVGAAALVALALLAGWVMGSV